MNRFTFAGDSPAVRCVDFDEDGRLDIVAYEGDLARGAVRLEVASVERAPITAHPVMPNLDRVETFLNDGQGAS